MSVVSKIKELGTMKKKDLLELQGIIEARLIDLDEETEKLLNAVIEQREVVLISVEEKKEDAERVERERLSNYEKTYADKVRVSKDCQETLKAIAQIFEIREKRKTAARSRLYGVCGVLVSVTGIGLAYGSDTFGTLVNKKTFEAAKTAVSRFIPKL